MEKSPFNCQLCKECCQGEGGIYFRKEQIAQAARLLDMEPEPFCRTYCRQNGERYEVLCTSEGVCALLGPEGCMIHQAKPDICRKWPFFPALLKDPGAFEEAKLACPGIDPDCTHAEFVAYARNALKIGD